MVPLNRTFDFTGNIWAGVYDLRNAQNEGDGRVFTRADVSIYPCKQMSSLSCSHWIKYQIVHIGTLFLILIHHSDKI